MSRPSKVSHYISPITPTNIHMTRKNKRTRKKNTFPKEGKKEFLIFFLSILWKECTQYFFVAIFDTFYFVPYNAYYHPPPSFRHLIIELFFLPTKVNFKTFCSLSKIFTGALLLIYSKKRNQTFFQDNFSFFFPVRENIIFPLHNISFQFRNFQLIFLMLCSNA